MRRRSSALAALATVAVAVPACGGGSGGKDEKGATGAPAAAPATTAAPPAVSGGAPPTSAPPRASKARYIKQADKVCRAARAQLVPIRSKIVDASKGSDPPVVFRRYAALTGRAASVYTGALGQLRGLDAPPADQAQIDRVNMLLGQIAGIMRANSAAAAAQDSQRLKALNVQAGAVADTYRSAAKAYGFRDCGQTVGASLNRRGNR
jgi:hypothetical protein